ncbi:DUF305 domain-containing protein [Nocardioides sp. CN2-186]|uniref:DUF305 domain-containing protein n=1 Tax=Nocardioides tweenelious TaxID=3156607 RepID=UPI0032B57463
MKLHGTRTLTVLAAAVLALALGACGTSDDSGSSGTHNAADVSFATEMIPHHEQALLMVDMTEGRDLSPEFEQLTQDIEAAQTPEIEQMQGWLKSWGEDVPSGSSGHMMSGGSMGGSMGSGMMSDRDLKNLRGAGSDAFEDMWLRMMIAHHEGAIEMAQTEIADGEYAAALDLARSIASSQQAQITQMKAMLADS